MGANARHLDFMRVFEARGGHGVFRALGSHFAETQLRRSLTHFNMGTPLGLLAKELLLEPAQLLFEFFTACVLCKHQLDQLFTTRLRKVFLCHTSLLLHLVSSANGNTI